MKKELEAERKIIENEMKNLASKSSSKFKGNPKKSKDPLG